MNINIPEPPPGLLDQCILLGVDPVTGTQPVFARYWDANGRVTSQRVWMAGDTFGRRGTYLRSVTYEINAKCQFVPFIALYREKTPRYVKLRLREASLSAASSDAGPGNAPSASSDAGPGLSSPFPSSAPANELVWRDAGPYYASDHLIIWPRSHEDLPPPHITSIRWNLEGLHPPHPHADHPFDLVPAFVLAEPSEHIKSLLHCCIEYLGHHRMEADELHYYGTLWTHYKLKPKEHLVFGVAYPSIPSLRVFVSFARQVIREFDEWGLAHFPHMAMATSARGRVRPWPQADEKFGQLEEALVRYHGEHQFQVSGYITVGDVPGSWNDCIGGLDHHSLFGNRTAGSHLTSVNQTSHSLRNVLGPGPAPDVFTSPRRPNLPAHLVNMWRKKMWSITIPPPPVPWNSRPGPTTASSDAPRPPTPSHSGPSASSDASRPASETSIALPTTSPRPSVMPSAQTAIPPHAQRLYGPRQWHQFATCGNADPPPAGTSSAPSTSSRPPVMPSARAAIPLHARHLYAPHQWHLYTTYGDAGPPSAGTSSGPRLIASSDVRATTASSNPLPNSSSDTHRAATSSSSEEEELERARERIALIIIETRLLMEKPDAGAPGTRRPKGITKSARRRANREYESPESSSDDPCNSRNVRGGTTQGIDEDNRRTAEDLRIMEAWDLQWQQKLRDRNIRIPMFGMHQWKITSGPVTQDMIDAKAKCLECDEKYRAGETVDATTCKDEAHQPWTCPICIEVYEVGVLISTTECRHVYHRECLNVWLAFSSRCCMCRREVNREKVMLGGPQW